MTRWLIGLLFAYALGCGQASAQEKFIVSIWGGHWQDAMDQMVAKKFTALTGVPVEYVNGGNNDRLTKAKIAGANPESDVTYTTSHWAYLYEASNLVEPIDFSRIPNAADVFEEGRLHKSYVGIWSYVYAIGYRPDLAPAGITFSSWKDLWNPRLKGLVGLHGTDPSHMTIAATKLAGTDAAHWEKAESLLLSLKPNVKAYFSSDATAEQLLASGEAPVLVMLSSTALLIGERMKLNFAVPQEGGVASIDVIEINKGTKHYDLALKYINILLDPEVQAEIANTMKVGPMNAKAKVLPETAKLPGIFVTADQWKKQAIVVDDKERAEKIGAWREWFAENMVN